MLSLYSELFLRNLRVSKTRRVFGVRRAAVEGFCVAKEES